jgi:hypothetical protein
LIEALKEEAIQRSHARCPFIVCSALLLLVTHIAPTVAFAQELSPDARALETEQKMTDDERFSMITSVMGAVPFAPVRDKRIPEDVPMSAGYMPGVPRLGVPALLMSDASLGVTNPGYRPDDKGATTLPASIVVGSSFNPQLAREGGAMLGREARIRGFNVMLACPSRSRPASPIRRGRSSPAWARPGVRRPPSATTKARKSATAGTRRSRPQLKRGIVSPLIELNSPTT